MISHSSRDDLANFARELAAAARRETLSRFAAGCSVEDKGAGTAFDPVTEADRAAEQAMRLMIQQRFPDHGIRGEEFGDRGAASPYSWSLDPIDGTRSFMCGLPTWTTLIALLDEGEPVIGLIDAPRLDETYVGTRDGAVLITAGAELPLQTSDCSQVAQARLSTTDPDLFEATASEMFQRLRSSARTVRFGHDGYAYARLAAGTLDLVVEAGLKPHDYNALIPVVRGAGGVFGDWRGGKEFAGGNVIAAASQALYDAAVTIMSEAG